MWKREIWICLCFKCIIWGGCDVVSLLHLWDVQAWVRIHVNNCDGFLQTLGWLVVVVVVLVRRRVEGSTFLSGRNRGVYVQ